MKSFLYCMIGEKNAVTAAAPAPAIKMSTFPTILPSDFFSTAVSPLVSFDAEILAVSLLLEPIGMEILDGLLIFRSFGGSILSLLWIEVALAWFCASTRFVREIQIYKRIIRISCMFMMSVVFTHNYRTPCSCSFITTNNSSSHSIDLCSSLGIRDYSFPF